MFTEDLPINSKSSRRLDTGEVLQRIGGPQKDDKTGISRVQCRSLTHKDDGWVTLSGNQGTLFLQPVPIFFHCIKEAVMTDGISIHNSTTLRSLDVNEIVGPWDQRRASPRAK